MQLKAAPQRSPFEVREDDLSLASESHALLSRTMGVANVEDIESFRETLSPATDPLVIPAMVCGLVDRTVVGVAVGAYLVEPNFAFVAYGAVDEAWRRRGMYTTLRQELIEKLRLHGAERDHTELSYVVSEMDRDSFLFRRAAGGLHQESQCRAVVRQAHHERRFKITVRPELVEGQFAQSDTSCANPTVEEGVAYRAPVAYEQPAVQGLEVRPLELVVRPMGVSTPPDRDEALAIVRHIYRRVYRIRDVESDPAFIRIARSRERSEGGR